MVVLEFASDIGHRPAENFADIFFFLTVNIWQFKTFDFIIFKSCKLNIELNERILRN